MIYECSDNYFKINIITRDIRRKRIIEILTFFIKLILCIVYIHHDIYIKIYIKIRDKYR